MTGVQTCALPIYRQLLGHRAHVFQHVKGNAIQSATKILKNNDWTRQKLLDQHALGGRYITLIGSPGQVADELESWVEQTGLDGFNLTRIVTPESYADFIDLDRANRLKPSRPVCSIQDSSSSAILYAWGIQPIPPGGPDWYHRMALAATGL